MNQPYVSVCMPAFNAGPFIDQAIRSIREQTYDDFELLILDDGSHDNTSQIASRHAASDARIRLLHNEDNRGLVFSRNRLLRESAGALVALADADDEFAPTRLAQQVHFMQSHPEVGLVGGNVKFVDQSGAATRQPSNLYTKDRHLRFFLMFGPCIWNTVTTYRKELLEQAGGFREGFDSGAEDYDLWCRLSKLTKLANLSGVLATVHVHEGSVTANEDATTKSNIYDLAQPLLSEYLGCEVSRADTKDIILLFWNGLGTRSDISNVLQLARQLKKTARQRESRDTYRLFASRLHDAVWRLGKAEVYANRQQSLEAIRMSIELRPASILRPAFAGYLLRLMTPDWIRVAVKSRMGAA